jgi:hypothetical protein
MHVSVIVVIVVITALSFDFTNGFHDTANAMATSIATGALKPRVAVAISAVPNVIGAFLSVKVASTISSGIVDESKFHASTGPYIVFGALIGAVIWNLLTWYLGLPSSSSHALFGGLIGATWIAVGGSAVLRHADPEGHHPRGGLAPGGRSGGHDRQGFAAETSAAAAILASSHLGFALSTTHVCSGGVIGSGVGRKLAEVRWGKAGQMAIAWVLTLPAAAIVGAAAGKAASGGPFGTAIVAVVGLAIAGGVFAASRRNPVTAGNVNDDTKVPAIPVPPGSERRSGHECQLGRSRHGLRRHARGRGAGRGHVLLRRAGPGPSRPDPRGGQRRLGGGPVRRVDRVLRGVRGYRGVRDLPDRGQIATRHRRFSANWQEWVRELPASPG